MRAIPRSLRPMPASRASVHQAVRLFGLKLRSRSEFDTTKTLENAIAAPAISGLSNRSPRAEARRRVGERPEEVALDNPQCAPRERREAPDRRAASRRSGRSK